MKTFPVILFALLCAPAPAPAAESYDGCAFFIDTLPTVITSQGVWCLRKDVATAQSTGNAISIQAPNVTIDCNGFKVGGLAAGLGTNTIGFSANGQTNLAIRGCNVRGFRHAMWLEYSDGVLVEDNLVEGATDFGIFVHGSRMMVRGNRLRDIGGRLQKTGPVFGLYVNGDAEILDNSIAGVSHTGAYGMQMLYSDGSVIAGNHIRDIVATGSSGTYGIDIYGGERVVVRDNVVIGGTVGTGITCSDAVQLAHGNTVSGFATQIDTCTRSGNLTTP